jgi:threonine aldolase
LGAPAGSVLLGRQDFILEALRVRKVLGGGMRQSGILAAAALYGLRHRAQLLVEDHRRARAIASGLHQLPWVAEILPVETNIVIARMIDGLPSNRVCAALETLGVRSLPFGADKVRFVTHFDFGESELAHFLNVIEEVNFIV